MSTQIVSADLKDTVEVLGLTARVICISVSQDTDLQANYIKNVTQNLKW